MSAGHQTKGECASCFGVTCADVEQALALARAITSEVDAPGAFTWSELEVLFARVLVSGVVRWGAELGL